MADLNDNLLNEASEQFIESSHKFVKPVRYFKSNDPYYWEIDNIPIKQLEENILFLRDQIANNLSISGIGRADLAELRPFVNGFDRTVYRLRWYIKKEDEGIYITCKRTKDPCWGIN